MSKIKLKPTPGYILIEAIEVETKTANGIYLPDEAKDKSQRAKVVAVGDKSKDENCPVSNGDIVIVRKYGGDEVKIDNKQYTFVKFSDILAIEEK